MAHKYLQVCENKSVHVPVNEALFLGDQGRHLGEALMGRQAAVKIHRNFGDRMKILNLERS